MVVKEAQSLQIREASEKEDFLKCWELMQLLHPQLNQDRYLTLMLYMLDEGYKLLFIEKSGKVLSICGYRYTTHLIRGRCICIDDLCTLPEEQGKGYARQLLQRVIEEAAAEEMQGLHLDLAHNRHDTIRFMMDKGFRITAHHLEAGLDRVRE